MVEGQGRVVRLNERGELADPLAEKVVGFAPMCSADGKVLYYVEAGLRPALRRCEGQRCETIVQGLVEVATLSPNDDRIAFFQSSNGGLSFQWIRSDGRGGPKQITEAATACVPEWSTNRDLWLAVRRGRKVQWTEFDVESGLPTGRTSPGSRDCSDGVQDPLAPVHPSVGLDVRFTTQVRILPAQDLRPRG
jgi:hypothetical protein